MVSIVFVRVCGACRVCRVLCVHVHSQRDISCRAYSSGTSNLLARLLRSTFATDEEYWAFPRQALYEPLGMDSALMETDAAGTPSILTTQPNTCDSQD